MEKLLNLCKVCNFWGGGTRRLNRGQEARRSRSQSISVILNLFQDLLTGGKDAKRHRCKASIEKNNSLSLWERAEFQCENVNSNIRNSGEGHPSSGAMCNLLQHKGEGIKEILKRVQDDMNIFLKRTYSPIHLFTYFPRKRPAFTLAEVLITLGIIGVVAAMTIPTLITTHNKRVVETRLEKFYSSMNQAIRMAELDYGARELWFEDNSDRALQEAWVKKYIVPYMNVIKVDTVSMGSKFLTIYFADGSAVSMSNATSLDWYFFPGDPEKCISSSPNRRTKDFFGRCAFAFYYYPNGDNLNHLNKQWNFEPYMWSWDGTENSLKNHSLHGCSENSELPLYCTRWIQINGWRIPDDYPFRVRYK